MGRVQIWKGPLEPSEMGEESKEPFTADTFLNFLRRSNPIWNPTFGQLHEQHWVYRGHRDASWPLVPTAARKKNNPLQKFIDHRRKQLDSDSTWSGYPNENHRHIMANMAAYVDALRFFMQLGNDVGVIVEKPPEDFFGDSFPRLFSNPDGGLMFSYMPIIDSGQDMSGAGIKPFPGTNSSIAALAQHHRVPTFLLDWTKNPWTAAYFASADSRNEDDKNDICVWAFNNAEAMKISSITQYNSLGYVRLNEPPKTENIYLAKQDGLLTYLGDDRGTWEKTGEYPPMEEIIEKWTEKEMREYGAFSPEGFGGLDGGPVKWERDIEEHFRTEHPILRKVILKKEHLPELRLLIRREGITRAHLMPTLDNIAKTAMKTAEDVLKI